MTMEHDIEACVKVLREGGIILYPTDTVWGLGCDATLPAAVEKVYRAKKREDSKSMIILIAEVNDAPGYANVRKNVFEDAVATAPKPVTVIFPNAKNLAANLIAEDGSIAMRITTEAFSEGLVRAFGKPIVSTSANISGAPAPACFREISSEIKNAADYVVEYRREETKVASPSRIVKWTENAGLTVIRE